MVLFGAVHTSPGPINGTPVAVTWEWDALSGWQQISGVGGPLATSRALHYDPARRVQVLGVAIGALEQVWERRGNSAWVQQSQALAPPSAAYPMVFDSRRNRLILSNYAGATWSYAAVVPATYATHGDGCAGTLGEPRLATAEPWTLPWLGSTMQIEVEGAPQSVAILATGLDDRLAGATPLPLDLSSLGMPGCSLRTAPDVVTFGLGAGTSVGFAVPVPNRLPLVSLRFYQQALVLDPAANAAGLVLSNSIAARPGTW